MNLEAYLQILNTLSFVLMILISILSFMMIISYTISLWFIFKKEEEKEIYSLIPFYNFYKIFKIVKIPFYTIFIPLVNIVVLVLLPYKLLKRYKRPNWMMILSIFFPYILMPYIAFSSKCKKPKDMKKTIKTLFELENIENKLINNLDIDDFSFNEELQTNENNEKVFTSKTEEMIKEIEKNSFVNDYFFESEIVDEETEEKQTNDIPIMDNNIEEIVEIFDQEENSLSSSIIDSIDEKIKKTDKNVQIDNAKYVQYDQKEVSTESIAFGGTKKEEDTTHNKNDKLKCSRCGSSLIGANGYCPGCGLKI